MPEGLRVRLHVSELHWVGNPRLQLHSPVDVGARGDSRRRMAAGDEPVREGPSEVAKGRGEAVRVSWAML